MVQCEQSSIRSHLRSKWCHCRKCNLVAKENDFAHINVEVLDAVRKGINLDIKWGLQRIELKTDLATVASWIRERRVKTKGANEGLVK